MKRPPHDILGVPANATREHVKKALHKSAKKYHPDKNSTTEAKSLWEEISNAAESMLGPKKGTTTSATTTSSSNATVETGSDTNPLLDLLLFSILLVLHIWAQKSLATNNMNQPTQLRPTENGSATSTSTSRPRIEPITSVPTPEMTVLELRIWLRSHNLPIHGRKAELVRRAQEAHRQLGFRPQDVPGPAERDGK